MEALHVTFERELDAHEIIYISQKNAYLFI